MKTHSTNNNPCPQGKAVHCSTVHESEITNADYQSSTSNKSSSINNNNNFYLKELYRERAEGGTGRWISSELPLLPLFHTANGCMARDVPGLTGVRGFLLSPSWVQEPKHLAHPEQAISRVPTSYTLHTAYSITSSILKYLQKAAKMNESELHKS